MGQITQAVNRLEEAPYVGAALAPEPGDPREHLLPVAALSSPIRVEIPSWKNSLPSPERPETVWLYRDGDEVGRKQWTSPIAPDDLYLDVDMHAWDQGEHLLHYQLQVFHGAYFQSQALSLWIDSVVPSRGLPLIFPSDLTPANTITARYLETHDDQVKVGVEVDPAQALLPGDRLRFYWSATLAPTPAEEDWVGDWVLSQQDLQAPALLYPFQGAVMRSRGDGLRYICFEVVDRAGNLGDSSFPAVVTVDAAPVPRVLPPAKVTQATGTPPTQSLSPVQALYGLSVEVPSDAIIYDDEFIQLQWGEPGLAGGWTSSRLPAGSRPWAFDVPTPSLGAHLGKTVSLQYSVMTGTGQAGSVPSRLAVNAMPSSGFPQVRCLEAESMDELRLSQVPDRGATLVLEPWPFIGTDQQVKLTVHGTLRTNVVHESIVIDRHAVTATEATRGLSQIVPKAVLERFMRGNPISLRAYISWDRGGTWPSLPNFPQRQLTLVD